MIIEIALQKKQIDKFYETWSRENLPINVNIGLSVKNFVILTLVFEEKDFQLFESLIRKFYNK